MPLFHYKVIYRNGDRVPIEIADFWKTQEGHFIFQYRDRPEYEFPGFNKEQKEYKSDNLWEQIAFRVSNTVRKQHPTKDPEELLSLSDGKLVTDHFEFVLQND